MQMRLWLVLSLAGAAIKCHQQDEEGLYRKMVMFASALIPNRKFSVSAIIELANRI
jgi:hypothetical protein